MIWRPRCIMKPVIEPASPSDDDRAALLVDARAGADAAVDDHVAAADRRAGERAGVAVDDDDAAHHVLARRPADAALDVHLGPVDQAEAEVAERAVEGDPAALQDADAERVARARVEDRDVADALLVDQPAQLGVDLARRQVARVELGAAAVDLRDARARAVDLDEAARVVGQRCPHHHLALERVVRVDLAVDDRADRDLLGGERDERRRPRRARAAWRPARPWPCRARPRSRRCR